MSHDPEDHFKATFTLNVDRDLAWERLVEHPLETTDGEARYWLPGFDCGATVASEQHAQSLRLTKDDEPCVGTHIVVTLDDADTGTRVTVVQSGFGDWMPPHYNMMAIGWRHIVSDLKTYLATGVHAGRHLRPWGDLGADVEPAAGGLRISGVRDETLAHRLGLVSDDLLLALAGAPVSNCDDLVTTLRVLDGRTGEIEAEWIRGGTAQKAVAAL